MPIKRAAGDSNGAPKRTRFASPGPERDRDGSTSAGGEDDAFLEADITESSRGAKKRKKRALRDQEGYGSDSSNDEESVVPSRRPKEEDDEDVDMFAADEDEEKETGKGGKKEKEFMDLEDVEGQEFDDGSGSGVGEGKGKGKEKEDSDSEAEEVGTGLDGSMGVDLTPFNMKNEMSEGRFTADGEAYVENERDPDEAYDVWLADADKEVIKKARRAHRERERIEREREMEEAERAGEGSEERELSLLRGAVGLLERGETVLEGLQRLGAEVEKKRRKEGKKLSWAERQKARKAESEEDNPFNRLSSIVSGLQAIGRLDVDSLSREAIQRMLPREPSPPRPAAPTDTRQFQYRFSLAYVRALPDDQRPVERETFGPFSAMQLRQWKSTGFFGPGCENIEVRLVKDEEQPWGKWDDVVGE